MIQYSSVDQQFNLNFTEPYLFDTQWTAGADAYVTSRQLPEYTERKSGGALRIGHPLAPFLRGFLKYKLDKTDIKLDDILGDPDIYPVQTANGWTSSSTVTLEYDKRDDRFAPTNGIYSSASLEYAGLGGQHHYTKGFFTARYYKKTFWDFVWRNNLTYGFIHSNTADTPPPYNELFLLGGANTLRGYDWYTVGLRKFSNRRYHCLTQADLVQCPSQANPFIPVDDTNGLATQQATLPFGGLQELIYQTEFEFPLITEAAVKGVVFFDIGYADDVLELSSLRSDWGFGFRWFSPIGPLRFEWGFPIGLKRELGETPVNFQFAIGSPF